MGYYIETPGANKGKGAVLCKEHDCIPIPQPKTFAEIPAELGLICIVDNVMFEAVAFAYNEREFEEFTRSSDGRRKNWYVMDRKKAEELSGYSKAFNRG